MIKRSLSGLVSRSTSPSYAFSNEIMNLRVPLLDPSTYKPTDEYIYKYENQMFTAYLNKKPFTRAEIWPKIHILEGADPAQQHHLSCQSLYSLKNVLDEEVMRRIAQDDPTKINSAYIISLFSEDHFKELIDQFTAKVVVSGKAPSQTQIEFEDKVFELVRQFYLGERITPFEREIEGHYLATKQQKHFRRQNMPKNAYLRCIWRPQDQRLLEDVVNWPVVDIDLSDTTYQPFFEPLMLEERLPSVEKFYEIVGGQGLLQKIHFNWSVKTSYVRSEKYISWVVSKLFQRTIKYTKCLDFTHRMKIPADFLIDFCVLNLHVYLIVFRLKQINTKLTNNIAADLSHMVSKYIDEVAGLMNIKKVATTKKAFHQMISIATTVVTKHFEGLEAGSEEPYKDIDALIWSCAFRERVERYGDQVYMFSDYFVKNWEHIQRYSEKDFLDGLCEFDPFLVDPDYKQKIQKINPPMSPAEFEKQFNSDIVNKSYYYHTKHEDKPFSFNFDQKNDDLKYSLLQSLATKAVRFYNKYMTNMDYYDHFQEMEAQKREQQKKESKSAWKTSSDNLVEVEKEFDEVAAIRKSRRNSSNISKENE